MAKPPDSSSPTDLSPVPAEETPEIVSSMASAPPGSSSSAPPAWFAAPHEDTHITAAPVATPTAVTAVPPPPPPPAAIATPTLVTAAPSLPVSSARIRTLAEPLFSPRAQYSTTEPMLPAAAPGPSAARTEIDLPAVPAPVSSTARTELAMPVAPSTDPALPASPAARTDPAVPVAQEPITRRRLSPLSAVLPLAQRAESGVNWGIPLRARLVGWGERHRAPGQGCTGWTALGSDCPDSRARGHGLGHDRVAVGEANAGD